MEHHGKCEVAGRTDLTRKVQHKTAKYHLSAHIEDCCGMGANGASPRFPFNPQPPPWRCGELTWACTVCLVIFARSKAEDYRPTAEHGTRPCFCNREPLQGSSAVRLWPMYIDEFCGRACLEPNTTGDCQRNRFLDRISDLIPRSYPAPDFSPERLQP